jgi:hypothetical protein
MRKKLIILGFALATAAASTLSTASADPSTCPKGSHLFVCPTHAFCCPDNAFCACLLP